jgi:predicted DNA-binding transcriptional regulator YafY
MSALTAIHRQVVLLSLFQHKRNGLTLKQIGAHMGYKLQIDGDQYLERTFQRDKKAILDSYAIEIVYNYSNQTYRIINSPAELGLQFMEAFELLNAVLQEENFAGHLLFDNRKALGMVHFQPLIKAIKNRVVVRFDYQKFDGEEITKRKVEPYALKEFKGRWYLLAMDMEDLEIKTFGLDRMSFVDITKKKFEYPGLYDPQEVFKNCFGITAPYKGQRIEELILEFTPRQYNYVKSYPLHDSQRDLDGIGPDGQRLIALNICLNYDLEMELLSYGDQVRVVAPAHFKKKMGERLKRAAGNY